MLCTILEGASEDYICVLDRGSGSQCTSHTVWSKIGHLLIREDQAGRERVDQVLEYCDEVDSCHLHAKSGVIGSLASS